VIAFRRFIVFRLPNFWLLISLLALVLLYPVLKDLPEGRAAVAAFDVVILILALRASHAGFGETWIGYALAAPAVLLQVIAAFDDNRDVYAASLIAGAIFHTFVVVNLLRYMLADSVMTLDELFAAANLYVLAAFIFAYLFTLIEFWYPASFIMNEANNPDGLIEFWELVYFSFTCLTSVGFGEITPNSDEVRSIVMIEQIAGVLYLALVISRLVTLQSRRVERRRDEIRSQRGVLEEHD
jgi:hypothetical protein